MVGCVAQRYRSCFPPNNPGFKSQLSNDLFSALLPSSWKVDWKLNPFNAYIKDFANTVQQTPELKYSKKDCPCGGRAGNQESFDFFLNSNANASPTQLWFFFCFYRGGGISHGTDGLIDSKECRWPLPARFQPLQSRTVPKLLAEKGDQKVFSFFSLFRPSNSLSFVKRDDSEFSNAPDAAENLCYKGSRSKEVNIYL